VDGVDISQRMLDQARALGIYTSLIHADVADYLRGADRRDDLVLAADVFIYVGDLDAVFAGVARVLRPGGWFGFTVERAEDDEELRLLPSLRYAHSEPYIRLLARAHGLTVQALWRAPLREDQQRPVEGLYVYLVAG
jgi:predicted TPR repeat methyltransferase